MGDNFHQIFYTRVDLKLSQRIGTVNPNISIRIMEKLFQSRCREYILEMQTPQTVDSNTSNQRVLSSAPAR
jgi:hypothetical protein